MNDTPDWLSELTGGETFVIAEAGSNHDGELETALELVDAAADAGADAVKFQTFRRDRLYAQSDDESLDVFESMEMPYDWIPTLHERCREQNVEFMSTPFDERSAAELSEYVPAYKVASFTLSHHQFLRSLAETGKPLIVSTGAHTAAEVADAVAVLRDASTKQPVLLHCVSAYPTPLDDIDVRVVQTLRERFDLPVGLSDHTLDPTTAPTASVALGGCIVEKHFTLDKSRDGPDHALSLEPPELETMVDAIRRTERALGDGEKRLRDVERKTAEDARRSVHTTERVAAGETFTESTVAVLRSGNREAGVPPRRYDDVVGARATRGLEAGEGVDETAFESD